VDWWTGGLVDGQQVDRWTGGQVDGGQVDGGQVNGGQVDGGQVKILYSPAKISLTWKTWNQKKNLAKKIEGMNTASLINNVTCLFNDVDLIENVS
jgi:hypothetical protein